MSVHRFARPGLTAVGFLIAATTLTAIGCGKDSASKPTDGPEQQKKPIDPPTILSPRKNDVMGYDFSVAGTYSASGKDVTVVVSGEVAGTQTTQTKPSWTLNFGTAKKDGDEHASATVPGSAASTVDFKVKGMPDLLAEHDIANLLCDVCTGKCSFDVKVTNTAVGNATITAALYNTTGGNSVHGPINLTQVPNTNHWTGNFSGVDKGSYGVQFVRTIAGTTVTCSRKVDVQ